MALIFCILRGACNCLLKRHAYLASGALFHEERIEESFEIAPHAAKIFAENDDIGLLGMMGFNRSGEHVDRFILREIDTVPHLEALLLLWNSRPQPWTVNNLASRLYISEDAARALLDDLIRRRLVAREAANPDAYGYLSSSQDQDQLLADLDTTYRREIVRVSTLIHSKPSASLRQFARAFRITKEDK